MTSTTINTPPPRSRPRRVFAAWLIAVAVCEAVGGLGAMFTTPNLRPWYASLHKPGFTPPNWVFGPAWTTLYLLMATAAWLVWRQRGGLAPARRELSWFAFQLALNFAWSPAFFGMQSPALGLAVIVPLGLAIAATTLAFWRVTAAAGALMLPYLAWVGYATALNFELWRLNP